MPRESRSILQSVRSTITKLPILGGFGGAPQQSQRHFEDHHLASMNLPAVLARQAAAHDRAVALLRDNVFSHSGHERSSIYEAVIKLLDISIRLGAELHAVAAQRNKKTEDPINQYLVLLRDTVQAAYALVTHELVLFKEEKQLSEFIGSEISSQFRFTDEIFANSELNIFHCVSELIETAERAVGRHRERVIRNFQKEDVERYDKAFAEFERLYRGFGKVAKDSSASV